jgi:predicted MFS family arabinose efflux permease
VAFLKQYRTIALVSGATAFSLLGDQVLYAVIPVMHTELGLSAIQVGILLSANRWVRLLTNELAHRLASSTYTKLLFVSAFALGAATTAAYTATFSFTILLLARLAWGLSWSLIRHFGVSTVMAGVPVQNAGRSMGIYNGISRAGSVAGLFGGAVIVDLIGFQAGMWVLAAISLLAIPLAIVGYQPVDVEDADAHEQPRPAIGKSLLALGVSLGAVGPGFVMSTLGAILVTYVEGDALFTAATLTGALLAFRYLIDSTLAPWLGGSFDQFGFHKTTIFYLACGGVALIAASWLPTAWVFVLLIVIFFNCATGLQAGVAGRVSKMGSGPFARYVTATDFGSAVGPLLAWIVIDQFGSPAYALALGGIVFVTSCIVVPRIILSTSN